MAALHRQFETYKSLFQKVLITFLYISTKTDYSYVNMNINHVLEHV